MRKNSLLKILAVLLSFCLCITSVALGTLAENTSEITVADSVKDTVMGYLPGTVTDFTGTVSGTSGGAITDFPRFYINTSNRDNARPRIALNEGVNGSNAMEMGALGAELKNYQLTFRFPNTNVLSKNTDYVVSLKVKKGDGEITEFKVGVNNNSVTYGVDITAEDISAEEWTEFSWTYNTGTWTAAKVWQGIVLEMKTAESGGSLIIDDMSIYAAEDATKTNLMPKGSFDSDVQYGTVVETDGSATIPVVIKDYTGTSSGTKGGEITDFPRFYENTSNRDAARPRIAIGEGVNGSNGLKIGALGAELIDYRLTFRFPNTNVLAKETDYIVSVKVKKCEGEITGFAAGVNNGGAVTKSLQTDNTYLSSENWTEFRWKYNTGDWTAAKVWQSVIIEMTAPAEGAILLLDDISIYSAEDETKTNILAKGSFDTPVNMSAVAEESGRDKGYVPVYVKDYTGIAHDSKGGDVSDFPRYYENTSNRDNARPRIAADEGVHNSNGLRIGSLGAELKDYRLTFRFANTSVLKSNTEYIVSVKIKKDEGEITRFTGGLKETNTSSPIMSLEITSDNISADSWTQFSWKHTTGDLGTAKVWSAVVFELTAPAEGASLLIDDICVYKVDDKTKTNIMYKGSFDTVCKKFAVEETTVTDKIVPVKVFDFSGNKNEDGTWNKYSVSTADLPRIYDNKDYHDETRPQAVSGGVGGSYALQVGGAFGPIENYNIGIRFTEKGIWENNTEYEVSVKLKKTQGNLNFFIMGYSEMTSDNIATLSDNDVTDEWFEYVWKFTTGDMASKAWNAITFTLSAPGGGATVLIDDLKVYEVSDDGKKEIYKNGSFEYVDLGQDSVNIEAIPSGKTEPIMDPAYNRDASGNGVVARIVACDTAPSGDYCLAVGFDPEKATSNTVQFTLHSTFSGHTYRIGFWAMVVGDVNLATVGFTAGDYSFIPYGGGYNFNQYQNGKWAYYEFTATDPGTFETNSSYRRFRVTFDAPAGSGMLIDKVTVFDEGMENSSDFMYMGDFEQSVEYPQINWKKDERFIYKGAKK